MAADEPARPLSARDAIVLGVVEGVTEFLPVSSTGHLIIASHLLELESDAQLLDAGGQPLWLKPPSPENPEGEPLTLKLAADTYVVVIQAGAIAAVVLLYWGQLTGMLAGLLGRSTSGLRLLRNIILACIPAVAIGLAAEDWIDAHLFSIRTVAFALISGAVLMFYAERWRRKTTGLVTPRLEPADLRPGQALGIGLMQCLALWPGMSRSMSTMVGGYFVGLSPAKAAEFSFLVGLPILTGAAGLKALKNGPAMIAVFGWSQVLLGAIVAAVAAAIAVKFLVGYLTRHGLEVFAIYRVIIAAVLFIGFI
ncbi:MAG: undecaprenyl-diphosphate phosphatase [Verrucomicrobiota bacterium]